MLIGACVLIMQKMVRGAYGGMCANYAEDGEGYL